MVVCPECENDCNHDNIDSNVIVCPTCNRMVYIIRDPRDASEFYPGISNSDDLSLPDCVLSGRIVEQSPTDEPPRNMIIDVDGGLACLLVQCKNPVRPRRRALEKTASALRRDVVAVWLPSELMSHIRSSGRSAENG
jgi:hypothetical protein